MLLLAARHAPNVSLPPSVPLQLCALGVRSSMHQLHAYQSCCQLARLLCDAEVVITPDFQALDEAQKQEKLHMWLELFTAANPSGCVDFLTGRIAVQLSKPAPGSLDFYVMVPDWQLFRSHHGSVVLLQRA